MRKEIPFAQSLLCLLNHLFKFIVYVLFLYIYILICMYVYIYIHYVFVISPARANAIAIVDCSFSHSHSKISLPKVQGTWFIFSQSWRIDSHQLRYRVMQRDQVEANTVSGLGWKIPGKNTEVEHLPTLKLIKGQGWVGAPVHVCVP